MTQCSEERENSEIYTKTSKNNVDINREENINIYKMQTRVSE